VLGDPEKRKKYDELGANWRMYEQQGAGGGAGAGAAGFPAGWSVQFGGGGGGGGTGGGFRTMTEDEMRQMFGEGDPFSDFFHTFFGGAAGAEERGRGRGPRQRTARAGRSVEQEMELGLEDAYAGTTRRLAISHDGHARTVDVRIPAGVNDGSRV